MIENRTMQKGFITSWDDARKEDIRLVELLRAYKIPAIFFIPSNCELTQEQIKDISKDFEIGGHTQTHPQDLKLLTNEDLFKEIRGNRKWLQMITGQRVEKFCYPRGRYDDRVIKVVKNCGFLQARTTVVMQTDFQLDAYRIRTSAHVNPNRPEYEGQKWYEVAIRFWREYLAKQNGVFHLWGHSYEIEKYKLWNELEEFFKEITSEMPKDYGRNKGDGSDNNTNQA